MRVGIELTLSIRSADIIGTTLPMGFGEPGVEAGLCDEEDVFEFVNAGTVDCTFKVFGRCGFDESKCSEDADVAAVRLIGDADFDC